jgi:DNA polymerase I-like protein with 3'-5' exonuclease and polymerase domains
MTDTYRERAPRPREADTPAGTVPRARHTAPGLAAHGGMRPAQAELWEPQADAARIAVAPTFPTPAYTVVTEPAALTRLLPQLQAAPVLGVDTETTGLDPLTDRLRLLQLATADRVIVVDLARVPVAMLAAVFAQEREWLVHNGLFDVRFVTAAGLRWSGRLFDTMLMSQLLGAGTPEGNLGQSGLGAVVQRYLGLQLPKALQHSQWDGPLTPMQLEYAVRDAAVLWPLADCLTVALRMGSLERAAHLENDCVPALAWLELTGLPVDAERWVARAQHEAARVRLLEAQLQALVGRDESQFSFWERPTVNWQSPAQVRVLLHARGHELTATDSKSLSTVEDPLVPVLLEYRDAVKRVGTYGREWIDTYRHPLTGRLHADYFQLGAWSGRMSCGNPNVQTIPRSAAYRSLIRVAPGRALIKADWSQIELRLAAVIAQDTEMLQAFGAGEDLHTVTAARVLGVPIPQVTKHHRQVAKALNFGLLYGMGAGGLRRYAASQYHVALTPAEAEQHRGRFFRTYPGLQRWHRQTARRLEQEGIVETRTLTGRRQLAVKHFPVALNSPVQGSGADGLKLALARLYHHREEAPEARLMAVIHDEVVAEAPAARAEQTAAWLTRHMTAAVQELVGEVVPIVVETTIGQDWAGSPL